MRCREGERRRERELHFEIEMGMGGGSGVEWRRMEGIIEMNAVVTHTT